MRIIREVTKSEFKEHLYNINIRDNSLYEELRNPNSIGIFQLNGKSASMLSNEVKPENFEETCAVLSLARPGPLEVAAPYYIERKKNNSSPYPQVVNDLLEQTHNTIIYQEQVMSIFNKIGGFSLEEANNIRGLMKKLGKAEKSQKDIDAWAVSVEKFKQGCMKNGIDRKMAEQLADDIVAFSGYSFNLSHAACYTYVAAMTLYLSVYFRKFFYAAELAYEVEKDTNLFGCVSAVRSQGFKILPPNINRSSIHLAPIGEDIIFGINDIKGVGEKAVVKIIDNKPYDSIFDFIIRTRGREVSSAVIKVLIKSGAFDDFTDNRKKTLMVFESFWEKKKSTKIEEKLKVIWDSILENFKQFDEIKTTNNDFIEYEKTCFGFNFFTSFFDDDIIAAFEKMKKSALIYKSFGEIEDGSRKVPIYINNLRTIIDKNGNKMAFVDMEDIYGIKKSVPIFASYWKYIGEQIKPGHKYLLNLFRSDTSGGLLFGVRKFGSTEGEIRRMVKRLP